MGGIVIIAIFNLKSIHGRKIILTFKTKQIPDLYSYISEIEKREFVKGEINQWPGQE